MTRKQEIYQMLIGQGLVFIRNQQSLFKHYPWWRIPPWEWKNLGQASYEVAAFLHNVPVFLFAEEFTDADFYWLNGAARSFFKRVELESSNPNMQFFSPMKQLFDLVPDSMKHRLEWPGPQMPKMNAARQRESNEFLFHVVEHNQNIESLRNALALGADLAAKDEQGRTALMIAERLGREEYVRVLVEAGAKE